MTEAVAYRIKSSRISIHTFLAEGDGSWMVYEGCDTISIHTFLAEGDPEMRSELDKIKISIHTFLAEGDEIL